MIPLTGLRRLDGVWESPKTEVMALHKKFKAEGKDAEAIEKIIMPKIKVIHKPSIP